MLYSRMTGTSFIAYNRCGINRRIIPLLFFLFVSFPLASQNSADSLSFRNASLKEVTRIFHKKEGFNFIYNKSLELIYGKRTIAPFRYSRIEQALDIVLDKTPIRYKRIDNVIVLNLDKSYGGAYDIRTVAGVVVDEKGAPMPSVIVIPRGSPNGTTTNVRGEFKIDVPAAVNSLSFSYIGYEKKELPIGEREPMRVTMTLSSQQMNELVVVGYGAKRRVNMTGAVASTTPDFFSQKGLVTEPLQALQGAVPGLTVTRTSGQPGGEDWQMEIRGATSINGTTPLVIIDDVPGDLSSVNPDDILTISVLKDASASVYGARAAGGVILVTTRTGESSRPVFKYKGNAQLKIPGLMPKLMNMQRYMETFEEAYLNDGKTVPLYTPAVIAMFKDPALRPSAGWVPAISGADYVDYVFTDQDWRKVLYGNAFSTSHNLGVSGRSSRVKYLLDVGFLSDGSPLQWGADGNDRVNIRMKSTFIVNDRLTIEPLLAFDGQYTKHPSLNFNIDMAQPGFPTSTLTGKPYAWGGQETPNWIAELGGVRNDLNNRFNSRIKTIWNIIKNLSFTGMAAANYGVTDRRETRNSIKWYDYVGNYRRTDPSQNSISRYYATNFYYNFSGYFDYSPTLPGDQTLTAMFGGSAEQSSDNWFSASRQSLLSENAYTLNLGTTGIANDEGKTAWGLSSGFARLNYSLFNKYMLELNGRYDGSSRFITSSRWKSFGSVSGGWRISQESFLKNREWLDDLKLRASWGTMGNQSGINLYDYAQLITIVTPSGVVNSGNPVFGSDATLAQTAFQSRMVSPNRTWEVVEHSNVGLDITAFRQRFSVYFDLFQKYNRNMLIDVVYPKMLGAIPPKTNNGQLRTRGWEASLNWRDKVQSLQYTINLAISDNQNKLLNLGGADTYTIGLNAAREGYPLNSYFGYQRAGLIETEEQLKSYKAMALKGGIIPSNIRIGDIMFKDISGAEGKPDGKIDTYDATFLGTDAVRFPFSITTTLNWNSFDFQLYLQGVGKRTIYRETSQRGAMYRWWLGQLDSYYGKTYSTIYNRLGSDLMPRLTADNSLAEYNYACADWKMENAAYLRVKSIVVGYSFSPSVLKKLTISFLRFYICGGDIFEIQSIKDGYDPESVRNPSGKSRYPFCRTVTCGLEFKF
ncbi:SusC/RagA family TonB-linked outer membrane protein [Parabacteroides sp. FAFU027]|uniref:SusC/RagA family TonB-linked outer membrane protein n=1 Tax=Parabacteroides sp. FAFU027 TaxID=2922715 RepID=UPI001FAFAA8C|nr:SusC/RagA family TonB-linked outer membrane protein [Parabacteroides sp. FAFU027]